MKKRIKFRLRNDLALPFWIAISICLMGALTNSLLFKQSFFRALEKLNEEPIATITFKYKSAQRKFLDRVVWDQLRQNSPVYNGDTIHTADLSEATVWFQDGTILDLAENTMAQVFLNTDGSLGADLEKGLATVDSSESSGGLTLTSENVRVTVKSGTKISAKKAEDSRDINLTVQKGTASLGDQSFTAGKQFLINESGETEALLSVTTPLPDAKILHFNDDLCPVDFKWSGKSYENLRLAIADDKDFTIIKETYDVSGKEGDTLNLPKGSYYWKLYSTKNEKEATSGKIQVIQSLKPELLAPASGYSYQFRKKLPSLRFIWSEAASATAYSIRISKNQDLSNPEIETRSASPSIIISTLPEGIYYWQVTPYYVTNRAGLQNPSDVGTFIINRRGELTPPELCAPSNGDFIDKARNTITLSWNMESEASSYKLLVAKMQSLNFPTFTRQTNENYFTFRDLEVSHLEEGQYYWAVTQIDSEGNESGRSEVRSFYVMNGKIEQKTIFPPEGYVLWKPLLTDTRFTWKTNINFAHHIQVADDSDFNNIVFDSEISSTSYSGMNLGEGTYWWRISTQEGNFKSATPGKLFYIVPELPAPHPLRPSLQGKAVVRPNENTLFEWAEDEEADYYRIKIYKGSQDTPVYDENFISETRHEVNLGSFEEGSYRWELQSYIYETELNSRRTSLMGNSYFTLRKIRPVTLSYPAEKTEIDGWDAIENPGFFSWKSAEPFSKAEIILVKKNSASEETVIIPQKGYGSKMPQLAEGTYEWTVSALTMDELDISATRTHTFTVKPIPPFEMPENARTEGTSLFNADYLRKTPYIKFTWSKVPRAYDYVLEILKGKNVVYKTVLKGNENTSLEFKDLSRLSKGDFSWQVRAVRMSDDGKTILIDGSPATNTFTIDYSMNKDGGNRKRNGDFYAQ